MIEFSVLMSVYKKDNPIWLKEALDSMVNQTLLPSEILIVQDGPITEELSNILTEYQTKYTIIRTHAFETNRGLGLTLRDGLLLTKYDYVARMDSDDVSVLNRFERQVAYFKANPKVDVVGSSIIEFEDDPYTSTILRKLPETHEEVFEFSKKRCPVGHSSVMFKKSAVLRAGNYRDFYLVEDYDLWVRMLNSGAIFYNFPDCITYMRVNKDFYRRRGGIKYYKSINRFKKLLKKEGHMSTFQYLKSNTASLIVCLMPGFLRVFIYKNLLRKKKKD